MPRAKKPRARYTAEITPAMVAGAIGAEMRKRIASMTNEQIGRLFLLLSTGKP